MKEQIKSAGQVLGGLALWVVMLAAAVFLAVGFIKGAQWLVVNVLQWVVAIGWIVLAIDVFVLLPLSLFRRARELSAMLLLVSSYVFGLATWLYGFAFTYALWGVFGVVIGLFMMGIGVVFLGIIATALRGMWEASATLLVLAALTFGVRLFSVWLGSTSEPRDELALR